MSSLKMTFSLASLILILGLVFATAPAMAQATINRTLDIGNSISDDASNPDNGGITDNISNVVDSEVVLLLRFLLAVIWLSERLITLRTLDFLHFQTMQLSRDGQTCRIWKHFSLTMVAQSCCKSGRQM